MSGVDIEINNNATASQFRQALANAVLDGGDNGEVSGNVVETDRSELDSTDDGNTALTGADSVKLVVQSNASDFTSFAFTNDVTAIDLNGVTGVLFNLADVSGKTVTDGSEDSTGTYIIKDTYDTINDAAEQTGGSAETDADFLAIFDATEIQITDYATEDSMARLDPSDSDVITAYRAAGGSGNPTLSDVQVTISANTTITDTIGAAVNNVTKVSLASGVTLTIENDALDTTDNAWSTLASITGDSGNGTETVAISDGGATNVDLSNISSLTDVDAVTIADTDGSDTINLSSTLTTSGIVTINLQGADGNGVAEQAADKILFAVDATDFTKASTDGIIKYTTVNNFEIGYDRIGLFYYGYDDSGSTGITAIDDTKRTGGVNSGDVSFAEDRTFIEDDQNTSLTALSTFDDVAG